MNQKRTIMGSIDSCISSFQDLKKQLINADGQKEKVQWAVGGLVATMNINLLRISSEVFRESFGSNEDSNARIDILAIKSRFNDFIDDMVGHE